RAHLDAEGRHLGRRQRAASRDELGERLSLDVLHRDEGTSLVLADVEDPHHVRMRQPRGEPRLADEAPPQFLVPREVLREALQRHRPLELDVLGEVDGGHRAVAERPHELVAASDERGGAHPWSPPSPPWLPWSWWWGGGGFLGGFGPLSGPGVTVTVSGGTV